MDERKIGNAFYMIDASLLPVCDPGPYTRGPGVVAWRYFNHGHYIQEVFRRAEGTYGFRYIAWVAWRDAGGEVREHGWYKLPGIEGLITDTEAVEMAEAVADLGKRSVAACSEWHR